MRNLLLASLLLAPLPAFAGTTITITVGSDVTETWTLSDADQQKFEAYVRFAYQCREGPNCTQPTLAEAEALWARATLQGTANNVTNFQNTVISKAATDAAAPIGFSVTGTSARIPKK